MATAIGRWAAAAWWVGWLLGWGGAMAQAATPVPPYPSDHVAVAGVTDTFGPLRRFLADFESEAGARYDVAVVAFSDPQDRPGEAYGDTSGAYIDSVVDAWRGRVDAEACVIVVMAIQNHDIIVHPCSRWARLGFERDAVVQAIDASPFAANARAGDYNRALIELIRFVDRNLSRRQADHAVAVREAGQELVEARQARDALAQRLPGQGVSDAALRSLDRAASELDEADHSLDSEDVDRAMDRIRLARELMDGAEGEQLAAARAKAFKRALAWGVSGLVLLLLLALVLLRLSRVRLKRAAAQREIASWDTLLARAGERLLALENEHAVILGQRDLVDRFDGASKDPIVALARRVDELFMAFERAQQVVTDAKTRLARGGFWRVGPLERALGQLTREEIVARTEDVKERKLFLPYQREVRMPARELLAHLEASYGAAVEEIDTLEGRMNESWAALDGLVERLRSCEAAELALSQQGRSAAAYQAARAPLAERQSALQERGSRDPLGVGEEAAALSAELDALLERDQAAAEAVKLIADEVQPQRQRLGDEVARLRKEEGLVLLEPGFEPDAMLARIDAMARDAWRAADDGQADAAHDLAAQASAMVAELPELVSATRDSASHSPARIQEGTQRSQRLRLALPERRERLRALREAHADEALQPALDNAQEAHAALDFADRCLRDAQAAVATTEQRYLAGAELVSRAQEALDQVDALFAEIEHKTDELDACQHAAERARSEAESVIARLESALDGDPPFASQASLDVRATLKTRLEQAGSAAAAPRPNWVAAQREAESLLDQARASLAQVEREQSAHAQAEALRPEVEAQREGVDALLRASSEDRPPANARLQQAVQILDELKPQLDVARPSWVDLYPLLAHARDLLAESKAMAQADFTAAEAARQAIAQADGAIRLADRAYGQGIRADLTDSRALLEQAHTALAAEDYEAAAQQAAEARTKALADEQVAVRAAAELVASLQQSMRHVGSTAGTTGSSWSRSWSSSSSSSHSSSRSSFGSSAGRSSFGSSAGRSSFGRSSGRTKW